MVDVGQVGVAFRLGPRVPVLRRAADEPTLVLDPRIPSRVVARATATTSKCVAGEIENLCEKPQGTSNTLPIVLGIVIPLFVICAVLLYLHRRNNKKQQQEDAMDPHKSLDFGLAMDPTKQKKRKSNLFGAAGEKDGMSKRQLSMDMNLSSPYLLPPEMQDSRESLHSLARTLHQNEDPYRPVTQYTASDVGSMRSFQRDGRDHSSIYTGSRGSRVGSGMGMPRSGNSTGMFSPPRKNSLPTADSSPRSPSRPHHELSSEPGPLSMPTVPPPAKEPFGLDFKLPELDTVNSPRSPPPGATAADGSSLAAADTGIQVPAPTTSKVARKGVPPVLTPQQDSVAPLSANHRSVSEAGTDELFIYDTPGAGLSKDAAAGNAFGITVPSQRNSNPSDFPLRQSSASLGQSGAPMSPIVPIVEEPQDLEFYPDEGRGRATHRRQSSEYPQEGGGGLQPGLDAPQFDTRRLSVGFRPLPPDEVIESEDPETRANRIRSFYKEYFEESKPDMNEYNQHYPPQGGPPLGESAAYFDPETNAFVMPYAQPVSRRAMTPPPSGSRFPGPRGPPRKFHGSMGGMSMQGGRGPPRPGSANSFGMGPRPGSSVSNMGPRSASNMSGKMGPRKPMPPPADLRTLPTPSKLRDDSAIFEAIHFAPPTTHAERSAGRSQSPLGERRPFSPKLPVSSPLVSSFDEMAALPSPHLLRKSSTFTSLDFAPPRKFRDQDTMSDAGSIRSNRSGISAVQQQAIRSGAGRVSRLPGDTVFTQAAMGEQLKPSWTLRP